MLARRRDHGQKLNRRGGGSGGGTKPCSPSKPDFSITTWARSSGEASGIARGSGEARRSAGEGVVLLDSSLSGDGVFAGLEVFFLVVDFAGKLFFFPVRFDVFGFGVGLRFFLGVGDGRFPLVDFFLVECALGVGDSSGSAEETARVFRNSSRLRFSSSLTCARRIVPTIAMNAMKMTSQRRKRTTDAQRNRATRSINSRNVVRSGRLSFRDCYRCARFGVTLAFALQECVQLSAQEKQ